MNALQKVRVQKKKKCNQLQRRTFTMDELNVAVTSYWALCTATQ